ncbi:MAG: hypothetical protein ACJAXN_002460 [Psychromonas sp.]|jgi:hypothetical protein
MPRTILTENLYLKPFQHSEKLYSLNITAIKNNALLAKGYTVKTKISIVIKSISLNLAADTGWINTVAPKIPRR